MRFFISGIMQGSLVAERLHEQDYRATMRQMIVRHFPEAEVIDPLADHSNSLTYDDATAREVFMHHNRLCRDVDVLLAYLPQASMGTAIEMWEAYQGGALVVAVSPMTVNWVVKFVTHVTLPDLAQLDQAFADGRIADWIADHRRARHVASRPLATA